jgi:hypothetical protein
MSPSSTGAFLFDKNGIIDTPAKNKRVLMGSSILDLWQ